MFKSINHKKLHPRLRPLWYIYVNLMKNVKEYITDRIWHFRGEQNKKKKKKSSSIKKASNEQKVRV